MKIFGKQVKKSFFVALAAIIITLAAAFLANTGGKNDGKKMPAKQRGNTVVSVKSMVAQKDFLQDYILTNGEVESQNSVSVFSDIGGKIISTSVMLGSTVKKGEIIAYIDPSEPGTNYKLSPVYAPISGSIITVPLKNGTKITTNSAITEIGDIKNLQITVNVPERYVAVLKKGLKGDVSVEAYPGTVFSATVVRVSPVVDPVSRTKQIILHFDREESGVNAGMFAKVKLYTQKYDEQVLLPSDSIVQNGDDFFAYVINENNTVSKRQVVTGKSVDGFIQILEGVQTGEKVVVQGMSSLGDGSKVQEVKQ